jgi:hypothetical protein
MVEIDILVKKCLPIAYLRVYGWVVSKFEIFFGKIMGCNLEVHT